MYHLNPSLVFVRKLSAAKRPVGKAALHPMAAGHVDTEQSAARVSVGLLYAICLSVKDVMDKLFVHSNHRF